MRAAAYVLLAACNVVGADDPAWRQAAGSLSSTAIRAHVEYLTDDLLEGRRAGARGEALAARYIAAQLQSYGFAIERRRVVVPAVQIKSARLRVTRGNVTVELKPGVDFAILSAPRVAHLDATPAKTSPWSAEAAARGASGLVPVADGAPLEIAIAPAALPQLESATARLELDLDLAEVVATDVIGRLRGRDEKCATTLATHHDSFGLGYPGASDAALQIAIDLEVARGLALAHLVPRCNLIIHSHGAGEWGGAPHLIAPPAHTPRDRIARDWNWEALKKQAQDALVRLAEAH